jgi:hypothetical protein
MATSSSRGLGCGILFLLPFVLVGAGVFVGLGALPMWRSLVSSRWSEVPCTIERAELVSSRGSKGGSTYRIEVAYTYRVQGQEHHGDRYGFAGGSTNIGVGGMRSAVERLKSSAGQRCWVDPADARFAVLDRGIPAMAWFGVVFGAVFGGVPLLILVAAVRSWRRDRRRAALGEAAPLSEEGRTVQAAVTIAEAGDGPLRLATTDRKGCGAGCLLVFAAIWNAVSWYGFLSAGHDWFGRIFLSIFLLVGAGMALLALYQLLALLNPLPELELDRGLLRPGGGATLRWSWRGNQRRLVRLEIALVGREEADYRRGTSTATDRRELSRTVLHESLDVEAEGSAPLRIPAGALPTLAAPNNRIRWVIQVKGDVPRFPDVDREFAITVLPPANGAVADVAPSVHAGPIQPAGGRTAFRPGDAVAGRIRWSLPEQRQRLELRLFWHTAGKGTVDTGVVDTLAVDQPAATGEQDFSLRIPAAGPVSCSGQLISVLWALELVADPGGALDRVDLVVGPTGSELRAP